MSDPDEIALKDLPDQLFENITSVLHAYSTALVRLHIDKDGVEQALHIGSGTFVAVGDAKGILTATHVVEKLESRSVLGLLVSRQGKIHKFHIPMNKLSVITLGKRISDEYGPDLALIVIADSGKVQTIQAAKSFWPLLSDALPPSTNHGIWFTCGTPEERIQEETDSNQFQRIWTFEDLCGGGGPDKEFAQGDYDYYEFPIDVDDDLPLSFSGMSGGAVWQVTLQKGLNGELKPAHYYFSGVTFFEGYRAADGKRFLRSHGRSTISTLLSKISL